MNKIHHFIQQRKKLVISLITLVAGIITILSSIEEYSGTIMNQGKALLIWVYRISADYVIPLMTFYLGVLLAYIVWRKKIDPIHIISWEGYSEVTRTIGDRYHIVEYIKELVNIELLRLDGRHFQIAILDVERVSEINQKYTLETLNPDSVDSVDSVIIEIANGHGEPIKIDLSTYILHRLYQADLLLHENSMKLLAIPIRWGFSEILYHKAIKKNMPDKDNKAGLSWRLFDLKCLQTLNAVMPNLKIVILNWYFPVLLQLFAARLQSRYSQIELQFPLKETALKKYNSEVLENNSEVLENKGQKKVSDINWITNEIKDICKEIKELACSRIIEFCPDFKTLNTKLLVDDNCYRIVFGAGGMVPHNDNYRSLSTAENGGFFWAECAVLPRNSYLNDDPSQIKEEIVGKFFDYVGELLREENQITLSGFTKYDTSETHYAIPISQAAMSNIGKEPSIFERQFGKVTKNDKGLVELQGLQNLSKTKHEIEYLWPRQVLEGIDDNIVIKRRWERIWEDEIVPIIPVNNPRDQR